MSPENEVVGLKSEKKVRGTEGTDVTTPMFHLLDHRFPKLLHPAVYPIMHCSRAERAKSKESSQKLPVSS